MKIYVNGVEKLMAFRIHHVISHDGAVVLAGRDRDAENLVTWDQPGGLTGVLERGSLLEVCEGMNIHVSDVPVVKKEEA